ncbi:hypothetical protein [Deinococcus maricopensis]|uniref:Lipoprotein n=1 Tax=Deinococcus maricopensis (strain DSM 21211 / LMG 22137 / NRRL B-23946 / LB-34) TaxID=709986 RepID=E8U6R4_DEIML|nr:hypothetical protein [Deinococcus maricopensis]ADV66753.1 hypothetical protein Deima_1100 [Deinococcus maricopensis DSM 21211]
MKRTLLLPMVAALAAASTPALADHQSGNLRDFTAADLCPPSVYVTVDDEDDDDFAADLEKDLVGALTKAGIRTGNSKTCLADLTVSIDAYTDDDEKLTYATKINLDLDLADPTTLTLGTRRLRVSYITLWDSTAYGTFNDTDEFYDQLADNLQEDLAGFIADWKTAHR